MKELRSYGLKEHQGNRNPLEAPFRFGFAQKATQEKSQLMSLILSTEELEKDF
jgi:hypothetical protein